MESVELYRQLLGLSEPWTVERVDLDVAKGRVEVFVGHAPGQRFTCPECGQELRLSVALAEPYLRAWITTAAAACIGAGGGLFLLCIVIGERRWPRNLSPLCQLALMTFIAMVPLGPLALIFRRRFLRLATSAQWFLAWLMVAVCALATFLFVTNVR